MVKGDINVIIDNLEDFYSSVFNNNNIRTRRFVIEKYNLGLTKLDTIESTNSRLNTQRVQITKPDTMSIKSFLFLPESTIRFSKVNLPGTDILTKANLNLVFLNYWEFLKKKTNVNNIFIDTFENDIEFSENNFANNIKQYILNLGDEEITGYTKNEIYTKFIQQIIPKTKILFNLMKKYIIGKLSIVGYHYLNNSEHNLPKIKNGILSPADKTNLIDETMFDKLNLIYARDYNISKDLIILKNAWRKLDR